jgi:hypothetical protein
MDLGNYVAGYPNPSGAGAVFPLTPVQARVTLTNRLFAANFGLPLSGESAQTGDEWSMRFMAVSASTALEQGNGPFEEVRRTLGIGCEPAYQVSATHGRVEDMTGRLRASAEDGAFVATLARTAMPTDLFAEVDGLTDTWTAAKQLNGNELRAITVHGGTGYLNVDLNVSDVSLVVGHPVMCDRSDVRIVAWWDEGGLDVFAHNPGLGPVECIVRTNDAFTGLPQGEEQVAIPAGDSVRVWWGK